MSCRYDEGVARGAQELGLAWRLWVAPDQESSLLLIHGLGEHSGRYDAFARALVEGGITVFSFDLRGHGRSEGPRGDVDAFPRFLEDLVAMEEAMDRLVPGREPRFLMGHSLGGLLCIRRLQVFPGPYKGAVISAPWLATAMPDWVRGIGRFLGIALPNIPLPAGIDPSRLTRDPEIQKAWKEDPLIHTRITGRFFKEAEREQKKALVSGWPSDLPGLFLVPAGDRVVRSSVTLAFARAVVGEDGSLEVLEGREHEPLNDVGREEVYQVVLDWLHRHVGEGEREGRGGDSI